MALHSATQEVISKFKATELHAARSGREVMNALAQVVADSQASNMDMLGSEIEANIDAILEVMPAYAPPLNVMHAVMSWVEQAMASQATINELKSMFSENAEKYRTWSENARTMIACYGAEIIPDGGIVFTFTLSETVLRTLREAWNLKKTFKVLVTESRPNNDGLVTTELLNKDGILVGVSVDACIGELVPQADIMMVGAEAIMADGSAVCKVGTYPSALVAKANGVPVFVVVDTLKFNITSSLGLPLWMEPISRSNVLPTNSPNRASVIGHLFDQTPPELIRGIVTERGILSPAACATAIKDMCLSKTLSAKLSVWAYHRQ